LGKVDLMNFVKRIFGAVDRSYLVRAYLISAAFLAFFVWVVFNSSTPIYSNSVDPLWLVVCFFLFPFAKLAWDEAISLILGNNVLFLNAVFLYGAKLVINILLWGFAWIVAPMGIIYLILRTRGPRGDIDPEQF